jgi:hypothetical protein
VTRAQATQAQMQAEKQRNAVRDLTLRQAQSEGFVTTPGSVTPSTANILLERVGGKTQTQQLMAVRNQKVTDRLARRAVGVDDTAPLTTANMKEIRAAEYDKGYVPLNNIGPVKTDQQFNDALDRVLTAYTGPGKSFPDAVPQPVQDLVQKFRVGQFDSKDAVELTRTLRRQADSNIRAGGDNAAVGLAQRALSNALEDQLERTLTAGGNPNAQAMLDQFRASRQRMAVSHAVEDAIVEGGGSVNAQKLANDLQNRGRYFSGDLDLIARFANIARPVMTRPGAGGTPAAQAMTAPSNMATLLPTSIAMGGAGMVTAGTPGLLAAAVPFVPQVTSAAARQYLSSQAAQRRVIPSYSQSGVNALAASDEALLGAIMGVPTFTNQPQNALAR